jgi:hypothetical protein
MHRGSLSQLLLILLMIPLLLLLLLLVLLLPLEQLAVPQQQQSHSSRPLKTQGAGSRRAPKALLQSAMAEGEAGEAGKRQASG